MPESATSWKVVGRSVSLEKPLLVGILNVTPDSFSDGGKYLSVEEAVIQARKMYQQGARVIDIGGESTRPGAIAVSAAEQIKRVVPVIERIENGIISIDTTSAEVVSAAITAGASIINDVSAGTEDAEIFNIAATSGAGLVLMHRLLPPSMDRYSDQYKTDPKYEAVVADVLDWLLARVEIALRHGVKRESIAIDPGLGFGKSVEQNMELVRGISAFVNTGHPVFVGASRKSFVGAISGINEPTGRDDSSAAISEILRAGGAQVFRVHDVRTHARLLQSTVHETDNNRR